MSKPRISPFANRKDNTSVMQWKRKKLFDKQDGKCYYCGIQTIYPKNKTNYSPMPDNLATVEHIYGRYDIRRAVCKKTVLSCYKCNCDKAILETKEIHQCHYNMPYTIDIKELITSND